MTFGQSFQITPIQMATTVSSLINGGRRVTPHFGVKVINEQEEREKVFEYKERKNVVSEETSATMRTILESVVSEGSGRMPILKDTKLAERQLHLRHFREVQRNIFPHSSDLHRQIIRRCWQ